MPNNHANFHSADGKRQVLVVDDEAINRELLGMVLQRDYQVLYAADGEEALQTIRRNAQTLSLVLLDLLMPQMPGLTLLKRLKEEPELSQIPVIVMTADQTAEIESLGLGAIDFIPKPYPQPDVILARVLRTIELSEDRQIIRSTERDSLTGLYNREYFYRYALQFDQHHKDMPMDAIVLDVNHFRMINERYGKAYGDEVLRRIGQKVREMVREEGGIVCRREADAFLVYCPHRENYEEILRNASVGLAGDDSPSNRVRLRMGVYPNADKAIDIERRFDRAKMAADTVRNNFAKAIAIYDNALHEEEIYAEQLLEDFQQALAQRQFKVYYQPKFDIRPEIPVLASAEALVRWQHPQLGLISPGVFIPLFEENGLIQQLDEYVWHEAARQVRNWRDRFGISVPVSVNVSRIDMYDPRLVEQFQAILAENGLSPEEFLLEITESAYTQDSAQIISTVNRLRSLGFQIEMDDFGTGYSSLSMISSLPIDALKLDMKFIRNAFRDGRDTRLIEVIIDIAGYLSVPVIAEGVETQEQLNALKALGVDLVQGYYFSKPVPPEEYERFVDARRQVAQDTLTQVKVAEEVLQSAERAPYAAITHALTSGYESIYYVDTSTNYYVQFSAQGRYEDLQIERSGTDFFADTKKNITRVVYPEDQLRLSLSMEKETLLAQLMGGQSFTLTYRLMIGGVPTYYNLRAVNATARDNHHIVIGVSNVEDQLQQALSEEAAQSRTSEFFAIAQALSSDFESIYYVDIDTDQYTEFTAQGSYENLHIHLSGSDFFTETQQNLLTVVYWEDQQRLSQAMEKETLLQAISGGHPFLLTYRLMIEGVPTYYQLKAVQAADDSHHIVIGVSNIHRQMTREQAYADSRQETITYSRIAQALSQDYYSIYLVNTDTDEFVEYSSQQDYQELQVEQSGTNFFEDCRRNILRLVYKQDTEKALSVWDKPRLMAELATGQTFSTTYRLMMDGAPVYINCKVNRMDQEDGHFIIIGVSNVDAQMRREEELNLAREKANRDALTGVKSKHAYVEREAEMDERIRTGGQEAFAVAVCDVNGLKRINDTLGHQAGDQLIRQASAVICNIFKHSPVFRTGGDEFVAILSGQDYQRRAELADALADINRQHQETGEVVIASGMADYLPGEDGAMAAVFQRADEAMYENKRLLKGVRTD